MSGRILAQNHRQCIGFLARRTGRGPDIQSVEAMHGGQLRKSSFDQKTEMLGLSEKIRFVRRNGIHKMDTFFANFRGREETLAVFIDRVEPERAHASKKAALNH